MTISFTVPCRPVPQARPRVTQNGRRTYTPRRSVEYRDAVALCARSAMRGRKPLSGKVFVEMRFLFRVPVSLPKAERAKRIKGGAISRPDWDNLGKAISDAMNGIVYEDDAQIVRATIEKGYALERPEGAYITVRGGEADD